MNILDTIDETDTIDSMHDTQIDDTTTVDSLSHESLTDHLNAVLAAVAPMWPLRDLVAVNPFLGLVDCKFLDVRSRLRQVRDCEMILDQDDFAKKYADQSITDADIEAALQQYRVEYPDAADDLTTQDIVHWLKSPTSDANPQHRVADRRFYTVAERMDELHDMRWQATIVNDISRHCGNHYDEGQAIWPSPWQHLSLFEAWRERTCHDHRFDQLGMRALKGVAKESPSSPTQAIDFLLDELDAPTHARRKFLLAQIFSVAGWASFTRCHSDESAHDDNDMIGLLAIRLAYDVALCRSKYINAESLGTWPVTEASDSFGPAQVSRSTAMRYVMLVASELAFRRQLLPPMLLDRKQSNNAVNVQMVFCIDVRSEIMRRHLESVTDSVATYGFAGFFGLPIAYRSPGDDKGVAQCPALITPSLTIDEFPLTQDPNERSHWLKNHRVKRLARKAWKGFKGAATSCFSFVESIGIAYLPVLTAESLGIGRPREDTSGAHTVGPDVDENRNADMSLETRVNLAHGMLTNLGITRDFTRLVVLCGHACEVANSPYRAAMQCGACGGHSGEVNARVAAGLCNDPAVRCELADRGIAIPDDTRFIPAVHITTTDEVRIVDTQDIPASHQSAVTELRRSLDQAGVLCRAERAVRLGSADANDTLRRSRDWSELRPEWGLAGNAAFVVAPRSRTQSLDLGGRVFMHHYEHANDIEGNVLETIMTAPMVVTSWINLQYYASSVDNVAFGSGNKAIHNVVGQVGTLLGNGGDLATGLPLQSVHDGQKLQHQPLRLLVVIEANCEAVKKVIAKHQVVRDLVTNGWVSLVILDNDRYYQWSPLSRFTAIDFPVV